MRVYALIVTAIMVSLVALLLVKPSHIEQPSQAKQEDQADWRTAPFIDHKGRKVTFSSLLNKPTILSFAFTGCSLYCPAQMSYLSLLQEDFDVKYGKENYQIISVSMAPTFDTVESLNNFATRFLVKEENWLLLKGSEAATKALIDEAGIQIIDYSTDQYADFNHTTDVYIINAKGAFAERVQGLPLDEVVVEESLSKLILTGSS